MIIKSEGEYNNEVQTKILDQFELVQKRILKEISNSIIYNVKIECDIIGHKFEGKFIYYVYHPKLIDFSVSLNHNFITYKIILNKEFDEDDLVVDIKRKLMEKSLD